MHARKYCSLCLLFLTTAMANSASAVPEYRITVVGPPNSEATDINNFGVVVGKYSFAAGVSHGFLNRGNGLVDLGTLGGTSSDARAINDRGVVLGNWTTASGEARGYTYRQGLQRDIGVIPGRPTVHIDINYFGFIIALGYAPLTDPSQPSPRSFLRAPDGTLRDIGTLPYPNPLTQAFALNNRIQITGASGPHLFGDPPLRAFIWSRGVMRDLGDLGSVPNFGLAINDRGQVAGFASQVTGPHDIVATLYSNGRVIDIDGRPPTAGRFSQGAGINNHGHIVGRSNHLSGFVYRGRQMESLNALIVPGLGWDIFYPTAINDVGQIAAVAQRNGVNYAVRLDLIRPSALSAPQLELNEEGAAPDVPASRDGPEAQAKANADAQAHEVVRPVTQ